MSVKVTVNKTGISQKLNSLIKPQIMKKVSHEQGKKVRGLISSIAQAYFIGMLKGCKALTQNSKVSAMHYTDNPTRRRVKGSSVLKRIKKTRKFVRTNVTHTEALEYKTGIASLSPKKLGSDSGAGIRVNRVEKAKVIFGVSWEYLNAEYARRNPTSEVFFRKRLNQVDGSTGARLIALLDSAIQSSNTSAKFNKGSPKYTPMPDGGMRIEFTINYPKLDESLDFLRAALVSGKENVKLHETAELLGILKAEMMRPMYRPYAAAMGRSLQSALRNSLKQ